MPLIVGAACGPGRGGPVERAFITTTSPGRGWRGVIPDGRDDRGTIHAEHGFMGMKRMVE